MKHLLQIVPHVPGNFDGVGDYALNLARHLASDHAVQTTFAVPEGRAAGAVAGFAIAAFGPHKTDLASLADGQDATVLHYVNYGYQARGIPLWLPRLVAALRSALPGKFVTVFHELYATGPFWGSAFWLTPLQKRIAAKVAWNSDSCLVSSEPSAGQLRQLFDRAAIGVQPVPSSFGEPVLSISQFQTRSPHRWAICGGSVLLERSLRSFATILSSLPLAFRPRELLLLGGRSNPTLAGFAASLGGVRVTYLPEVSVEHASELLITCSFGWLDYFTHGGVPLPVILKSSSFASFCAHGVIPVFPQGGTKITISEDTLPGPYFVEGVNAALPSPAESAHVAREIYEWYHRRAALPLLSKRIAAAIA